MPLVAYFGQMICSNTSIKFFKRTFLIVFLFGTSVQAQSPQAKLHTSDIDHFWEVYDLVHASSDSAEQLRLVQERYVNRGTPGLHSLMQVRDYDAAELTEVMLAYPKYWASIRANTLTAAQQATAASAALQKLQTLYPKVKPADVYFAMGAFRSGGTYYQQQVLLGAEFVFADQQSTIDELPARSQAAIRNYAPTNIPLTVVHEYIHTQQRNFEGISILHSCVAEGVAEFLSTLALGSPLSPPIAFGKQHQQQVIDTFMREVLRDTDTDNWLYGSNANGLLQNDLGYFIGYAICEAHYQKATHKKAVIAQMMELEYLNDSAFAAFVDGSGVLPLRVEQIYEAYENARPKVLQLRELAAGTSNVPVDLKTLTITFSEPMSSCCRSIDPGPDPNALPIPITKFAGLSPDGIHYTLELSPLEPNTTYQLSISNFAKRDGGNRLAPYLISFTTAAKP